MHRPFAHLAATLALFAALPVGAATVVMKDDFSDHSSGWSHQIASHDRDSGFNVYTDSGKYQITPVKDDTYGLIPAPRQAGSGNVRIESDLFLYAGLGAGAAGLACREQDLDNFYGFLVRGDGVLLIVKVKDGKPTPLAKGRVESVMAGSVDTRLTVECNGDVLRVAASNGSRIEARDSEFDSGGSALIVIGQKMAGSSGSYDNFVLTDLGGAAAGDGAAAARAATTPATRNAATDSNDGDANAAPEGDIAARVGALRAGQALVVVEHDGYTGSVLIERDAKGLHTRRQWNEGGAPGMNLYINHSGDSFYTTLRTGSERSSAIASWDVEIDEASGQGTCKRMDIYKGKPGALSVWSSNGERACQAR